MLSKQPFQQVDLGEVNLMAVPYVEKDFSDLVDKLHEARDEDRLNILLLHGTLSATTRQAFGEETRYLPFTAERLLEIGVKYVFAGHIHSSPTKRTFGDGECIVAYPGSPVSITTKEINKRGVWLFDTSRKELHERDVESFHYVREELEMSSGEAKGQLEQLAVRLSDRELDNATVLIEPSSFIEMDESTFFERLNRIVEDAGIDDYEIGRGQVESAKAILDSKLYQEFERKLEEKEVDDQRAVRRTVLQALSAEERGWTCVSAALKSTIMGPCVTKTGS